MIRLWPQRRWRQVLLLAVVAILVPYLFSRLASPSRRVSVHSNVGKVESRVFDGKLRIACFNIAHGRGLADSNWEGGDRTKRRGRLTDIAELLDELDADVVVLNEVDFDASWSEHVNQAELLAFLSGYPYRAEQRNLDVRILGWTWRFGNAVLSKYPIKRPQVIDLPSYSNWETILAGKKRAVACDLAVDGQLVRVIAAHLSHRSEGLRVNSAEMLTSMVRDSEMPTVLAGDLNSTPPDFPHSNSDTAGRNAIAVFDESGLFRRAPSQAPPTSDSLTFPADQPDRVIDWILGPHAWELDSYRVVPTQLSDHRPVVATFVQREQLEDKQ